MRVPASAEASEPHEVHAAVEPAPRKGRRILVVDDNRDAAESLAALFGHAGNQTHIAHDGHEAFELAASSRPDVVVLDLGLPKRNGYDTARAIRGQPWGKTMVLVALTGWGQAEAVRKSGEAGFDAHLVKPVKPEELLALLDTLSAEGREGNEAST